MVVGGGAVSYEPGTPVLTSSCTRGPFDTQYLSGAFRHRVYSLTLTLTLSLYLALSLALSLARALPLSLSLSLAHSRQRFSLSRSLSLWLARSLARALFLSLSLSFSAELQRVQEMEGGSDVAEQRLFFFFTLVLGPRRSLSLKLSDTRVYEPQIRTCRSRQEWHTRGLQGYLAHKKHPPP